VSNEYREEGDEHEVDDRVDDVVGITRCTANECVFEREVATSASAKPWRKLRRFFWRGLPSSVLWIYTSYLLFTYSQMPSK
jgi:hypothetical protein